MSKGPTTSPLDEDLIRLSVQFATAAAGYRAAYDADPCGNSTHVDDATYRKAEALLQRLAGTTARTMDGVDAKARAASFVFDPLDACEMHYPREVAFPFLAGLVADCARVLAADRGE